jgi:predicted transcriptional regulator
MIYAIAMVRPNKLPSFVKELLAEAKRQDVTAYRLAKDAGVPLATAHRLLAGDLNPTASTLEAIAKALGVAIKVDKPKP